MLGRRLLSCTMRVSWAYASPKGGVKPKGIRCGSLKNRATRVVRTIASLSRSFLTQRMLKVFAKDTENCLSFAFLCEHLSALCVQENGWLILMSVNCVGRSQGVHIAEAGFTIS